MSYGIFMSRESEELRTCNNFIYFLELKLHSKGDNFPYLIKWISQL